MPLQRVADQLQFRDAGLPSGWVSDIETPPPAEFLVVADAVQRVLGGKPHRRFCRKLMAGQCIAPHIDEWIVNGNRDIRRFQVPILTHPEIVMRWLDDDVELHLEPGWIYEVRHDRTHEVVNHTECDRIHIQIDQMGATI